MNRLSLSCPKAGYGREMRIDCAAGGLCGHQRYMPCKGWCVLTEGAGSCPRRKENGNGEDHKTGEGDPLAL